MKNILFSISILYIFSSCSYGQPKTVDLPIQNLKNILFSFQSYYKYENQYINLSKNYIANNQTGVLISKEKFLNSLSTGRYLPILTAIKNGTSVYKLYLLPKDTNDDITGRLTQLGKQYKAFYDIEGKKLPDFNFIDLKGIHYTNSNTANKILVIKCWFLNCVPCVLEMPALNAIVERYKNRKDIIFLAPAFDSKTELNKFMAHNKFNYNVIPSMKDYMVRELNITAFPTHLIVVRGKVFKVVENVTDLTSALNTIPK